MGPTQNRCIFHTMVANERFPTEGHLNDDFIYHILTLSVLFPRNSTLEVCLTHEHEPSRGFTLFTHFMDTTQSTTTARHATTLALRVAVMRVVKQRNTHRNFLQASAETEARLLEVQPNSIFMYGL